MESDMLHIKTAGVAGTLIAALVASTLYAAEPESGLPQGHGVRVEIGPNASAHIYWVNRDDGWHVVTTVDTVSGQDSDAEEHAVVRFSSVLLPGQSQLISIPLAAGEQSPVLRIRRLSDRIEVTRLPAAPI
jgi:hypothetical protein